jgi:elongation factor P
LLVAAFVGNCFGVGGCDCDCGVCGVFGGTCCDGPTEPVRPNIFRNDILKRKKKKKRFFFFSLCCSKTKKKKMMRRLLTMRHFDIASRGVRSKASTLVSNQVVEFEGALYRVDEAQHVSKGRWKAYMQVDLRALASGKKRAHRFRTDELVEVADTTTGTYKFVGESADDDEMLVFEDSTSNDTVLVRKADVHPDHWVYLRADDPVRYLRTDEKILECVLPAIVRATVADTPDNGKPSHTQNAYKPALLTNGRTVQCPQFVNTGDEIHVKLPDETYHSKG